jgi:hypothetical protein
MATAAGIATSVGSSSEEADFREPSVESLVGPKTMTISNVFQIPASDTAAMKTALPAASAQARSFTEKSQLFGSKLSTSA